MAEHLAQGSSPFCGEFVGVMATVLESVAFSVIIPFGLRLSSVPIRRVADTSSSSNFPVFEPVPVLQSLPFLFEVAPAEIVEARMEESEGLRDSDPHRLKW